MKFFYENNEIDTIVEDDIVWFCLKDVAKILDYKNTRQAIIDHVEPEDKTTLEDLKTRTNDSFPLKCRGRETRPLNSNTDNAVYINESGLYSLILKSKTKTAKELKNGLPVKYCHQFVKLVGMNIYKNHIRC